MTNTRHQLRVRAPIAQNVLGVIRNLDQAPVRAKALAFEEVHDALPPTGIPARGACGSSRRSRC
jgi:hypothetical protein